MNFNEIVLPRKLTNELLHLAQTSPDQEICGLIGAGNDGRPKTCYPIPNAAETPENRFLLDTTQHISALRQMREKNEILFAIYHSHPTAPAILSKFDIEGSSHTNSIHIIISLNTKGILELRAYGIKQEKIQELSISLIET